MSVFQVARGRAIYGPRLMAQLDGIDGMALLFLFVIVLVLCVVASCLEAAAESRPDGTYALAQGTPPASPRRKAPPRARERSPIWRTQRAEQARQEEL